jgi:hypothetical protein
MNGPETQDDADRRQMDEERQQWDDWLASDEAYLLWLKQFDREEE